VITQVALEARLLDALRRDTPPASAGEWTRALNEMGVNVERPAVKRALEALVRRECGVFAWRRVFVRNGHNVEGSAYSTMGGLLLETKAKGAKR
jgi:hypothetical protein